MKQKHSLNFMIGLLIGGLVGLLFWYWQKSTSAEDGALQLLDKLAATERRARQLKESLESDGMEPEVLRRITLTPSGTEVPSFLSRTGADSSTSDDLTMIKGIGAVFNGRLQQANIDSFAQLKELSAETVADILQISLGRAEIILAEAQNHPE
jgi:predicted flap endonuclease-1-like 5' DNA nuclease